MSKPIDEIKEKIARVFCIDCPEFTNATNTCKSWGGELCDVSRDNANQIPKAETDTLRIAIVRKKPEIELVDLKTFYSDADKNLIRAGARAQINKMIKAGFVQEERE